MLVGFAEGLRAAKTYAIKEGCDVDNNRELIGLGAANLGSGLSGGMVAGGAGREASATWSSPVTGDRRRHAPEDDPERDPTVKGELPWER